MGTGNETLTFDPLGFRGDCDLEETKERIVNQTLMSLSDPHSKYRGHVIKASEDLIADDFMVYCGQKVNQNILM